jgi:hypothetical protein
MRYNDIEDEAIGIFKGNCVPGDGCPVVVTAAGRRLDDQLVGEYYVFVCDRASTIYQQSVTAPAASSVLKDGHEAALDASFMTDFLVRLAEERLNSHLYETQKQQSEPSFREHVYRLDKADSRHLLYVHLRGSYASQLHQIAQSTKFIRLTRLIGSLETLQIAKISEIKGSGESA